jgi:hypothetical protein
MEEDEEQGDNISDWAQYDRFVENTIGEVEGVIKENDGADDLGQMLYDVKNDCESEKEVRKLERMLADHKMSLYSSWIPRWNSYDGRQKMV